MVVSRISDEPLDWGAHPYIHDWGSSWIYPVENSSIVCRLFAYQSLGFPLLGLFYQRYRNWWRGKENIYSGNPLKPRFPLTTVHEKISIYTSPQNADFHQVCVPKGCIPIKLARMTLKPEAFRTTPWLEVFRFLHRWQGQDGVMVRREQNGAELWIIWSHDRGTKGLHISRSKISKA